MMQAVPIQDVKRSMSKKVQLLHMLHLIETYDAIEAPFL